MRLQGLWPARQAARPDVVAGRWFTDEEMRGAARIVVVSRRTAEALGPVGTRGPGQVAVIGGQAHRIIGIVEDIPGDRGLSAIAPLAAVESVLVPVPQPRTPSLQVTVRDVEQAPEARRRLQTAVDARADWRGRTRIVAHGPERLAQVAQGRVRPEHESHDPEVLLDGVCVLLGDARPGDSLGPLRDDRRQPLRELGL